MQCILSGMDIPKGMKSLEHIAPRHWLPPQLYNMNQNRKYAIKIFNSMKGDLFLCEWYDLRIGLCYKALDTWKLKQKERKIIEQGLYKFLTEPTPTPCKNCICFKTAPEYCIKRGKNEELYNQIRFGLRKETSTNIR